MYEDLKKAAKEVKKWVKGHQIELEIAGGIWAGMYISYKLGYIGGYLQCVCDVAEAK